MNQEWWSNPQPRPHATHRLLCLPHAGGSPIAYAGWPAQVPPSLDLQILQLPGRADRMGQPLVQSMPVLMQALVPTLPRDKPLILFGHSMGGHIAIALMQALKHRGLPLPVHAFIAASRPVQTPPPVIRHTMTDDALLAEIRSIGGTPEVLLRDPEFRALILGVVRADFSLFETWHPTVEALPVPITALASPEDGILTPAYMAPWQAHTSADFAVESFAGGHFFPHTALQQVLTMMRRRLAVTGHPIN